jgi:hypothetical protein
MSFKLLDKDLATELLIKVKADGFLWASLPTAMKVKYLEPYLNRQVEREASALSDATSNQRAA